MTDESPSPSKIIPNSFQKPNWIVDVVMRYLPGEHYKCLDVVVRKTLGWLKERDRIATSQIVALTGYSDKTVYKCMKDLCSFGLVLKTDGNNAKNQGNEWALQLEDRLVDISGLMAWNGKLRSKNSKRTSKARASRGVLLSHSSTVVAQQQGTVVTQQTQKPLSKANISLTQGAVNFQKMTASDAYKLPSLQLYQRATGFFPGSQTWEYVHTFITKNNLTEEQIRTASTEWAIQGYKRENVKGILEWALEGVPSTSRNGTQKKSGAKARKLSNEEIDKLFGVGNGD